MLELEKRLRKHAEITKSAMHSPFDFDNERKEFIMTKKTHNIKKIAVLAAAALCIIGTTVFAAYHLMSARDVASSLGDSKLAQYFDQQGFVSETVTDGDYKATVLGITSGENLSDFKSSSWEIFSERTYAVVAVEKTDGTAMTYDDEILVTPLISGLKPWQYNIFTMNGGYTADIIDGILYRIIEFDSIEYFADRDVYMAVLSQPFLNNTSYAFDESTGEISPKEDFDGTNILIKLNLDKSKADPEKAQEYLDKLNEKVKTSDDEPDDSGYDIAPDSENTEVQLKSSDKFNVETEEDDDYVSLVITDK